MLKKRAAERPDGDAAADDAAAFADEMRDVVPLPPDPRGRVRATSRPSVAAPAPATRSTGDDDSADAFAAPGVNRREIRRLKGGGYPAADSRDLHGLTAAQASAVVRQFIESSRRRGLRCVSIVHGRGLHSDGQAPILKTRVREYLRSQRAVLAYADAPRADGGPGAVYVLLRK